MSYSEDFLQQSSLMLKALQLMGNQNNFALKGGTAINYFYNNMPRISVDIDLVFVPLLSREQTIQIINNDLSNIANTLIKANLKTILEKPTKADTIPKIKTFQGMAEVKIETNGIFRGTVLPPEEKPLAENAARTFQAENFTVRCSSLADIYAGKFCAALTRQHPRDLFDIKHFFEGHKISDELRQAFVVYLSSDRRPFHEILNPNIKTEQRHVFENEFIGMTNESISYEDLIPYVGHLASYMRESLKANEIQFILSMAAGEPDWNALPYSHLMNMPSLQWKLKNIKNMEPKKRKQAFNQLQNVLGKS